MRSLLCLQRFLLLDEISTGLDSATTFSVVKYLATATHMLGLTTVISLLQPPPEVTSPQAMSAVHIIK